MKIFKFTKRNAMNILIVAIMLVLLSSCNDKNDFYIEIRNDQDIINGIERFCNRSSKKVQGTVLLNKCKIDNLLIVSNKFAGGYQGYTIIEWVSGDKYKIINSSSGTSILYDIVLSTDKGKYLVAIGKEYTQEIQYLKLMLDNKKYIYEINGKSNFIQYYKIPDDTEKTFADEFFFIDKCSNDITNTVSLKKE